MAADPALPRVVLDTNILVSGVIVPHGAPAAIIAAWRRGRFTLLMSSWQRAELADVLRRPRLTRKYDLTNERIAAVLLLIDTLTVWVDPDVPLPVDVRDSDDAPILGMALAGEATDLVTGDDDLRVLAADPALRGVRIVSPRRFLAERDGGAEEPHG